MHPAAGGRRRRRVPRQRPLPPSPCPFMRVKVAILARRCTSMMSTILLPLNAAQPGPSRTAAVAKLAWARSCRHCQQVHPARLWCCGACGRSHSAYHTQRSAYTFESDFSQNPPRWTGPSESGESLKGFASRQDCTSGPGIAAKCRRRRCRQATALPAPREAANAPMPQGCSGAGAMRFVRACSQRGASTEPTPDGLPPQDTVAPASCGEPSSHLEASSHAEPSSHPEADSDAEPASVAEPASAAASLPQDLLGSIFHLLLKFPKDLISFSRHVPV